MKTIRIISGSASINLSNKVAAYNDVQICSTSVQRFSDGETMLQIHDSIRGKDTYIIQSTSNPANENLMELLITIDALRRASAGKITAVLPYFGYARQDRKTDSRVPITSKLVANMIQTAGADRVVIMDLHSGQVQGFFDIPTDNVYVLPMMAKHLLSGRETLRNTVVVSPDVGGVSRARKFAENINAPLAIVDKRRPKANDLEVMNIIGDVKDMNCILVDDMVDTAGTLCKGAEALKKEGATSVSAICVHGVLSGPAIERIEKSCITSLIVSDTIEPSEAVINCDKIEIVSVGDMLGEVVRRIHNGESLHSVLK